MLTKLKEQIQLSLVSEARLLYRAGLTPNHLTILGLLFAYLSAIMYWISGSDNLYLLAASVFLLVSGFLDALDGVQARLLGQVTAFGGFLDSLLDRYADAFVFLGIILGWLQTNSFWIFCGFVAMIGSLLVSYSRARAEAAGIKMESVGLAERAERIIILVVATLLNFVWNDALRWSVFLLAIITNFTVLQRAFYFRKSLKNER